MNKDNNNETIMAPKLWTKDFTIITLGSVVSMLGNSLSGFAMNLLVLDYTKSTFLYAIYIMMFTAPSLITPVISGAFLDRFSRKRTIYTLDFISAGLFVSVGLLLRTGWFSFPIFAAFCFVLGCINSIYMVAYDSFYPLLVAPENYTKAYSIASVLDTLSMVAIPVSTFVYKSIGIVPLMLVNAGLFFIAACMETRITAKENYIDLRVRQDAEKEGRVESYDSLEAGQEKNPDVAAVDTTGKITKSDTPKKILGDLKEGLLYLWREKGLLAIALYFTVTFFGQGASSVISLPYFRAKYTNGEYIYMLIWSMNMVARALMGSFHYKHSIPKEWKFKIALMVYITIQFMESIYFYMPVKIAMIMCFITGAGGITSYTIRISATQRYVPDEMKGRFNGAFQMLGTIGSLTGEALAGALTVFIPQQYVLSGMVGIGVFAAIFIIGTNRKYVEPIYNV